ncbi:fumarylacetoacetate hydrolase family protein [Mumia sp. DW29H23]|uniref:fumarylacetoacetate hydrolase family protein n=1 Tax=Mumia sp. DW29H23 TaxID=3421241 RepID=UPI003D69D45B
MTTAAVAVWPPDPDDALPADAADATLVGRVLVPGVGPSVVTVRDGALVDVTAAFPTVRDLAEHDDPAAAVRAVDGPVVGSVADVLGGTPPEARTEGGARLLSPIDLQAVKAAGVTFAVSMLERVIEERARGNASEAERVRQQVVELLGTDVMSARPGSPEAEKVKEVLVAEGMWSQYLEVGLGPDAEIFTKTSPMASVGTGVEIGVHPRSSWNNPEPEVVLLVSSRARVVGATLGNDVNLRDFEGRSALLLTKAKDNNASTAIGPFVRLFDDGFGMDDVRSAEVALDVTGEDAFVLAGSSSMTLISRDPEDLVGQLMGAHHQYPDGAVLFLGTMFAPVEDRDTPGDGFTHHDGDVVRISAPRLGALVNRVRTSDRCEPWTYGTADLFRSLASRGLL